MTFHTIMRRIKIMMIKKKIKNLDLSATLKINEISKNLEKEGKEIIKFGFGQSPFQVPDKVVEELKVLENDTIMTHHTHKNWDDKCWLCLEVLIEQENIKWKTIKS